MKRYIKLDDGRVIDLGEHPEITTQLLKASEALGQGGNITLGEFQGHKVLRESNFREELENNDFQILAFTGHRPEDLPPEFGADYSNKAWSTVKSLIQSKIKAFGTHVVICGGARGLDTAAALAVLDLKMRGAAVSLHLELPFKGQEALWPEEDQLLYQEILRRADSVHYQSDSYTTDYLYLARNKAMVDQAEALLALWNYKESGGTYYTVRYAVSKAKPIINIWDVVMEAIA